MPQTRWWHCSSGKLSDQIVTLDMDLDIHYSIRENILYRQPDKDSPHCGKKGPTLVIPFHELTWLSRPISRSMKKKIQDQRGAAGIKDIALG